MSGGRWQEAGGRRQVAGGRWLTCRWQVYFHTLPLSSLGSLPPSGRSSSFGGASSKKLERGGGVGMGCGVEVGEELEGKLAIRWLSQGRI